MGVPASVCANAAAERNRKRIDTGLARLRLFMEPPLLSGMNISNGIEAKGSRAPVACRALAPLPPGAAQQSLAGYRARTKGCDGTVAATIRWQATSSPWPGQCAVLL